MVVFNQPNRAYPQQQYMPKVGQTMYLKPRLFKGYRLIKYGSEIGLPPQEIHNELRAKKYTGDEIRNIALAYSWELQGATINKTR